MLKIKQFWPSKECMYVFTDVLDYSCNLTTLSTLGVYHGCFCDVTCMSLSYNVIGVISKKYKTFSVLIYSYILIPVELVQKNDGEIVWKRNAHRSGVFIQFRAFPAISTSVDITVYQYG